jgi:hypothetical protein
VTNTNKHDANKHVPKDKHEQIHEDKQHLRERRDAREERRRGCR